MSSSSDFFCFLFGDLADKLCLIPFSRENESCINSFSLNIYDEKSLLRYSKLRVRDSQDIEHENTGMMTVLDYRYIIFSFDTIEEYEEAVKHKVEDPEYAVAAIFIKDLPSHLKREVEDDVKDFIAKEAEKHCPFSLYRDIYSDLLFSIDSVEEFNILLDLHGGGIAHDE